MYADVAADDAAQGPAERTALRAHATLAVANHPYNGALDAVHLCTSNDHRQILNERCNEDLRPRDSILVRSTTGEPDFWCYPSMVLAALHTIGDVEGSEGRLKLLHDVLYRVQSVGE